MNAINKDIEKYISDVGKNLVCAGKLKKQIMADLENEVYDYAESNGIGDISQIVSRFGSPQEIAQMHLADAEPQTIKNAVSVRRILVSAAIIAVVLVVFCYLISCLIANESNKNILRFEYTNGEAVSYYESWE